MAQNIGGGELAPVTELNNAKAAAVALIEAGVLPAEAGDLQAARDRLGNARDPIDARVALGDPTAAWDAPEEPAQIAAQLAQLDALVVLVNARNAANALIVAGAALEAGAIQAARDNALANLTNAIAGVRGIVPVAGVVDIPVGITAADERRKNILDATLDLAEAINATDAQLAVPAVVEPADARLAIAGDVDTAIAAITPLDAARETAGTAGVVNFDAVDARIAQLVGAITAKSIAGIFQGAVDPDTPPADVHLANPAGPAAILAAQEAIAKLGEARKAARLHNPAANVAVLDQRLNQLVSALVASTDAVVGAVDADDDATITAAIDAIEQLGETSIAAKAAKADADVEALNIRVGELVTALVGSTAAVAGAVNPAAGNEATITAAIGAINRLANTRVEMDRAAYAGAAVAALTDRVGELVTALVGSTQDALDNVDPANPATITAAINAINQLANTREEAKKANADVGDLSDRVDALVGALVESTQAALDALAVPGTNDILAAKDAIVRLRLVKTAALYAAADVAALDTRVDELLTGITDAVKTHLEGNPADQNLTDHASGDLADVQAERTALNDAIAAATAAGRDVTEAQEVLGHLSAAITKTEIAADLTGATKGYGIHSAEKALNEWKKANDELQIAVDALQIAMLASPINATKEKQCREAVEEKEKEAAEAKKEAGLKVRKMKYITGDDANDKKLKGLQKVLQYKAFIEDKRYLAIDIMYDINIATGKLRTTLAEIAKQEAIITALPAPVTNDEKRKKAKAQQQLAALGQEAWIEAQKIEALDVQRAALQKEVQDRGVEVKAEITLLGVPFFDRAKQQSMIDVQTKSFVDSVAGVADATAQVTAWNNKLHTTPALVNLRLQAEETEDLAERDVRAQFKAARLLDFTPESIWINGNLRASYEEMLAVLAPGEAPGESAEDIQRHLSIIFKQPRPAVAEGRFIAGALAWLPDGKANKEPLKLKALDGAAEARAVAACRLAQTPSDFVVVGTTDKHGVPEFHVVDNTTGLDLSEDLILVAVGAPFPPAPFNPNTLYLQQNADGILECAFGAQPITDNIKGNIPKGLTQAQLNEEPLRSKLRRGILQKYAPQSESLLNYVKRELASLEGKTNSEKQEILARIEAKITDANKDPRYGTSAVAKAINKEIAKESANIPHADGEIGKPLWDLMDTTKNKSNVVKRAVKDLTGANDCSVATQLDFDVMRNVVAAVVNQHATNPGLSGPAVALLNAAKTDAITPEIAAKADALDISGNYQGVDPNVQYKVTEDKVNKEVTFERLNDTGRPLTDDETCTIVMRTGKDGGTEFELSANTMADVESMIKDAANIMSQAPGGEDQVPVISIGKQYKKNFGDNFGHDKSLALRQATYIKAWMDNFPKGHVPVLQTRLKQEGTPVAMWDTYRDLKRGAEKDTDKDIKEECKKLYLDRILGDPKQKAEFIDGMFAQTVTHPDQQGKIVYGGKAYSREELKDGVMKDGSAIDDGTYRSIFAAQANKPQGLKANRDSDIKEINDVLGLGGGRMLIK